MLKSLPFYPVPIPLLSQEKGKSEPRLIVKDDIDTSNGVIFIFPDNDTGVFYLVGKVRLNMVFEEKSRTLYLSISTIISYYKMDYK